MDSDWLMMLSGIFQVSTPLLHLTHICKQISHSYSKSVLLRITVCRNVLFLVQGSFKQLTVDVPKSRFIIIIIQLYW